MQGVLKSFFTETENEMLPILLFKSHKKKRTTMPTKKKVAKTTELSHKALVKCTKMIRTIIENGMGDYIIIGTPTNRVLSMCKITEKGIYLVGESASIGVEELAIKYINEPVVKLVRVQELIKQVQ
jgi:hypothetical protein